MSVAAPAPLRANCAYAFRGEQLAPARRLSAATVRRLQAARNATGKPNHEVLREFLHVTAEGEVGRATAIDFPSYMSAAEAALYVAPFATLQELRLPVHAPGINEPLRQALARVDRFLATPAAQLSPAFDWVEGEVIPDDSLVVWARDDDFSAGVLASRAFAIWCELCPDVLSALRAYPFPWEPGTALSALSRAQEDQHFALARAARAEDDDAILTALAAAYGWPMDLTDEEMLPRLCALHAQRAGLA